MAKSPELGLIPTRPPSKGGALAPLVVSSDLAHLRVWEVGWGNVPLVFAVFWCGSPELLAGARGGLSPGFVPLTLWWVHCNTHSFIVPRLILGGGLGASLKLPVGGGEGRLGLCRMPYRAVLPSQPPPMHPKRGPNNCSIFCSLFTSFCVSRPSRRLVPYSECVRSPRPPIVPTHVRVHCDRVSQSILPPHPTSPPS